MRVRRTISFGEEDDDLVALLDASPNASETVRDALRARIRGKDALERTVALLVQQHEHMLDIIKRLELTGVSVQTGSKGSISAEVEEVKARIRQIGGDL